ncbi:MAG: putative RDD family membrane protein YckC [Candidatus Azotimanducaceae bacterium]|jgi:uncharacterized RDD family membrane protein YckC
MRLMNNTDAVPPPLAGRFRRLIATTIDAVLVPTLTILLIMVFGVVEHAEDYADYWLVAHMLGLAALSYLLLNGYGLWRRGQTLGKKLCDIGVVAIDQGHITSAKPSFWKLILIRALFFPLLFVAIIPWYVIVPLIDLVFIFRGDRRCLHDLISGTAVIDVGSKLQK